MFDGIVEFVAVAQTHGFSSAATKLGVSTSHVSRKVAQLEASMGVALVARTTRSVKLTGAGEVYFQRCLSLMNGLEEANQVVSGTQVELTGVLRVSGGGDFAERFIAPALMDFAKAHPKLTIDMDLNPTLSNLLEDGFDFAIRYGVDLADSSLVARKLLTHQKVVAASEEYLAKYGVPKHPNELNRSLNKFPCVRGYQNTWRFSDGDKEISVMVGGGWKTNNARAMVEACKAGLGLAYLPVTSFGDAFAKVRLQPVLTQFCELKPASWIVYPNRQYLPAKARLAIDFLFAKFAKPKSKLGENKLSVVE